MNFIFLKRISAYLIDVLVVLVLSSMLSTFLPNNDKLVDLIQKEGHIINEYVEVLSNNDSDSIEEYSKRLNNYSYKLNKLLIYRNLVIIGLYFLYFIVFQSYNNGQTIGKRLLKIEIVDINNVNANFKQLLIRGIVLYPIIFSLLNVISLFILKQSTYMDFSFVLSSIQYILFTLCSITMVISGRGLHDKLAGTFVLSVDDNIEAMDGKVSKWKKSVEKENKIKKYRINHTSSKRKG